MEDHILDDEKEYAEENDEKQESDLKVILWNFLTFWKIQTGKNMRVIQYIV